MSALSTRSALELLLPQMLNFKSIPNDFTSPMADKKLFLLDAYALIYRAYFALAKNPLINSKGKNVSAIHGFTSYLVDILTKYQPTHIAVAFDTAADTERHSDFADYKANRQAAPEDITASIPYIKTIMEAMRIP